MAFLINLYNAATLELIIDHHPVESIKDIGGLLGSPWKQKVVRLFGEKVTLNHVEHDLLRPNYDDPQRPLNCLPSGPRSARRSATELRIPHEVLDPQVVI